ncbi:flagellar motor switch protein FliG [Frigidibacter oleivorans]|uniref:flagellar motor switch protein FliG n=1 Tax=Frigidibacter oleivorans TaxID=2487129 RepID=UPI000F8E3708|nr:flagellar motor switch protein FliG [Frigidibacter oleivorans]
MPITMTAPSLRPGPLSTDAAVLMFLFGDAVATRVLRHLSPVEIQKLGAAMYAIDAVDETEVDRIVEEFLGRLAEETGIGHGTPRFVQRVMTEALGPDRAQSVIGRINPKASDRRVEILDWMDEMAIHELIVDEHPQIIALVLACLPHRQAADVLGRLPEDSQSDIVRRIAQIGPVSPEALQDLETVLQRKFTAQSGSSASQIGGMRAAARIMNFARGDAEGRILRDIRKDDKDLMTAIQDNMFTFDNLGRSDDRSLQTLLRAIEPDRLALALKGADETLRDRLLSCLSARAAAGLRDEMEAMGPVRLKEVIDAQKQIVAIARGMADEGTIVLAGRGGEEMV